MPVSTPLAHLLGTDKPCPPVTRTPRSPQSSSNVVTWSDQVLHSLVIWLMTL